MTKQTMQRRLQKLRQEKGLTEAPRLLVCAAECSPFAKTGGLADVVGTLPAELRGLGFDARVILPYHRCIKERYSEQIEHLCAFAVDLGWRSQYVGLERLVQNGVIYYFIDNEFYFGDKIYRGGEGEIEQYCFFCRAVLEALPRLDFFPDVMHCNDWHTAILPLLLRTQYAHLPQGRAKSVLTIHNLAFQGRCSFAQAQDLLGIADCWCTAEYLEFYSGCNFLKGGCVFADHITTVSPSYAREILTPFYGEGLDGVLSARQAQLSGIVNGIDMKFFNPAADPALPCHYDAADLRGKAENKRALLEELGLQTDGDRPLLAMVGRLTEQKGLDLVLAVMDEIMANDLQFVLLGSGDAQYEDFFRAAEARWKGRFCAWIGYHEALAHRIYAASDYFLMPSRFEPCGLSQLIAMRYGSLPIVRETGGLRDTVQPYNRFTGEGTGFSFANYNAHEMSAVIRQALALYPDTAARQTLIRRAMEQDLSFLPSAFAYGELFLSLL